MSTIRGVVFDWGGVLIEDPSADIALYCSKVLGVLVKDFVKARDVHLPEFALGRISEEVFWQRLATDLGVKPPASPTLWGEAFRQVYTPRPEVFEWIETLRQTGCHVGVLSNTEPPAVKYFQERYSMFDATVFSCTEGILKPDPPTS